MKKFIFLLFAVIGMTLSASADTLSCPVYNANGAIAKVTSKGGQASENGKVQIPVTVTNVDTDKGCYITVWVEAVDQDNKSVVKRASKGVWIGANSHSGSEYVEVTGLTPGRDYLYRLDTAKLCE